MDNTNFNWDAVPFFRELTHTNNLARQNKFTFCCVSGLEGFEEALHKLQNHTAFVCVSDIAKGYILVVLKRCFLLCAIKWTIWRPGKIDLTL